MNNGYVGYSMSVRAREAYQSGEMPKSKWKKENIIEEIKRISEEEEIVLNFNIENLNKINAEYLKEIFLTFSSWHHTSSKLNKTDFYSIDVDKLEDLTDEKINDDVQYYRNNKRQEKAKEELKYAMLEYEEWYGSKRYGKFEKKEAKAIIYGNWAYLIRFIPTKKRIDGKHILNINYLGTRKPKSFDTKLVNKTKKSIKKEI